MWVLAGLNVFTGEIVEVGEAEPLAAASLEDGVTRPTGARYSSVSLVGAKRKAITLASVIADTQMAARLTPGSAGRFGCYAHGDDLVLCGYSDGIAFDIAAQAADPLTIAIDAKRTAAKRTILLGIVLIPTLIGITFGIDKIKAGRRRLRENPRPRRPSDNAIRKALAGRWF